MARSKPHRTRSAFTLIELLIAILIIGILAGPSKQTIEYICWGI